MKFRFIYIVTILFTLLLSGCGELPVPDSNHSYISFDTGTMLLNDDILTRSATLKSSFTSGDIFFIYGAKFTGETRDALFEGDAVDYDGSTWSYEPLRLWDRNATRYVFLGISGPASSTAITCNPAVTGPLTATLNYNVTESQYDLIGSCAQRADGSTEPVHMDFWHLLSAVSVVVYNDSPSQDITLNSYGFKNLCTGATVSVEHNGNKPRTERTIWSPSSYDRANVILGSPDAHQSLSAGGSHYPTSDIIDLMIPQSLNPLSSIPALVLDYQYRKAGDAEDTHVITPINLPDIFILGSETPITEWLPGKRYQYEIHIRLGGGVRVHVTTTDWEIVSAETPGLMI